MPIIKFTHQGHSAMLGSFSPGDRKVVTHAEAQHFVDQAMAAVIVSPDAGPDETAQDKPGNAPQKQKAAPTPAKPKA